MIALANGLLARLQVANVLFLDSPAFVGWSYSENQEDRIVGELGLPFFWLALTSEEALLGSAYPRALTMVSNNAKWHLDL